MKFGRKAPLNHMGEIAIVVNILPHNQGVGAKSSRS